MYTLSYFTKQIEAVVGEDVNVLSSAEETAKDVQEMLAYNGTLANANAVPAHRFLQLVLFQFSVRLLRIG